MTKLTFQIIPFFGESPEKKKKFIEFQKTKFSDTLAEFLHFLTVIRSKSRSRIQNYEAFMCELGSDREITRYLNNTEVVIVETYIEKFRKLFEPEFAELMYLLIIVPPNKLEMGPSDEAYDPPLSYSRKLVKHIESETFPYIDQLITTLAAASSLEIQKLLLNLENKNIYELNVDMSLLDKINEYEDTSLQISDEIIKQIPVYLLQTYMLQFDETLLAKRIRKLL